MNEFMSPVFALPLALLAGTLLGVFFFAGLWWTVRKLESTNHVALLLFGSMLLRTGVVISGFYYLMGDNWQRLVAGLLGFIIARFIVIRSTRMTEQSAKNMAVGG